MTRNDAWHGLPYVRDILYLGLDKRGGERKLIRARPCRLLIVIRHSEGSYNSTLTKLSSKILLDIDLIISTLCMYLKQSQVATYIYVFNNIKEIRERNIRVFPATPGSLFRCAVY